MGNAGSCTPNIISSNGAIKVMFFNGRVQIYTKPINAADLMLENPGQFVCDSSTLVVGNRIHGLTAEEELERRRLYFILPMELLYSVLTHEEMSSLNYKATKALKYASFSHLGKIFPVCMFPAPEVKVSGDLGGEDSSADLTERFVKQRSWTWRPALETIVEVPSRQ